MLLAACTPRYFRDIPTTFTRIDTAVTEVKAPATSSVLVFVGDITLRGPSKARTIVLGDGTPLGQVAPMTWIAVDVPAGEQTILTGIPEDGSSMCGAERIQFEAGKVYLYDHQTDPAIQTRTISLTSRLVANPQAGRAQVSGRWSDYWKPCADHPTARVLVGVDALPIPQPP